MGLDPAHVTRQEQEQKQADGKADAPGQGAHRAIGIAPVLNKKKGRAGQAADNDKQHDDDEDFDEHSIYLGLRPTV